ncbi:SUF system Fe-S cluster assembly protein [Acetobacter sp. TBRC 12305]|uniref:SUF system Fe-S cluster assembly protein n=1 Tax=Acetobacter garciniae TaxID=2817435 RepID=A0A939KQS9_9PROT|nr:SUF system Fe-S cluster assembly protein [Acetobacter garciniae]MBO1325869.1 SUF system Fe-S cluster assembly protein [Acetobacter garciniae]MBX0345769.1 SUF system Fe-S cluster assembly protein [Acetobacter garciniae]
MSVTDDVRAHSPAPTPEVLTTQPEAPPVEDVLHADHAANAARAAVESWRPDGDDAEHAPAEDTPAPKAEGATGTHPSEDAVIEAIATVHDPEIPVNIYELGLIYAIDLYDDGRVRVEMTLTAPNCPSAQELPVQVKDAVEKLPGVTNAEVEVVWDPPWDMSRMSDEARLSLNMF